MHGLLTPLVRCRVVQVLEGSWSSIGFPSHSLGRRCWKEMFSRQRADWPRPGDTVASLEPGRWAIYPSPRVRMPCRFALLHEALAGSSSSLTPLFQHGDTDATRGLLGRGNRRACVKWSAAVPLAIGRGLMGSKPSWPCALACGATRRRQRRAESVSSKQGLSSHEHSRRPGSSRSRRFTRAQAGSVEGKGPPM